MHLISQAEQEQISEAIVGAEARTSGEIVAVVTAASDNYLYIASMWAAMLALLVPWPLIYMTWLPVQWIFALQIAVFIIFFLLFQWMPIRLALVPRSVMNSRAHAHAVEQFLAQNLHTARGRTGILIFVSVAEHYAEIIADEEIYKCVSKPVWQGIVDELIEKIRKDDPVGGFISAIEASGDLLSEHYPPGEGDMDELPNHLIVLE